MVDLYADFVGGRSEYDVNNMSELKREVAERLNRNDINWNLYNVFVNDEPVNDDYQFNDGDVVKVMSPGIKGGE